MIIWLIGLSGAGKTTIGNELVRRLKPKHSNLVFIDGDQMREMWGDQVSHDIAGRLTNAQRIERVCAMLDSQNIHVVAAVLSIFPERRRECRQAFSNYFEVFIDTPMNVLKARDSKQLYSKAERGEIENVIGVDIPFPYPDDADLVISAPDVLEKPERIAELILAALPPFGK